MLPFQARRSAGGSSRTAAPSSIRAGRSSIRIATPATAARRLTRAGKDRDSPSSTETTRPASEGGSPAGTGASSVAGKWSTPSVSGAAGNGEAVTLRPSSRSRSSLSAPPSPASAIPKFMQRNTAAAPAHMPGPSGTSPLRKGRPRLRCTQ